MLLPQCNVSRFSHRREIRVNACWICHSSVCKGTLTSYQSHFLLTTQPAVVGKNAGGGVKKAQSTTGTSMIDSGLRLLICSPYKNSHVACELQIIVKNTQSLTYTCTYNKVVIKCTYKKKVKFVFILDIFWMICSASLLFFFPRAW